MKMTVITDSGGNVVASTPHPKTGPAGGPVLRLRAGPGQTAHEIDLPADLEKLESAEDLHKALKKHLGERRK